MFHAARILAVTSLTFIAGIGFHHTAWASGGGSMEMPSNSMSQSKPLTAEEKAVMAYDAGVSLIKDADEAVTEAAKAMEPKKQKKAQERAKKYFGKAQAKFEDAVKLNPD